MVEIIASALAETHRQSLTLLRTRTAGTPACRKAPGCGPSPDGHASVSGREQPCAVLAAAAEGGLQACQALVHGQPAGWQLAWVLSPHLSPASLGRAVAHRLVAACTWLWSSQLSPNAVSPACPFAPAGCGCGSSVWRTAVRGDGQRRHDACGYLPLRGGLARRPVCG